MKRSSESSKQCHDRLKFTSLTAGIALSSCLLTACGGGSTNPDPESSDPENIQADASESIVTDGAQSDAASVDVASSLRELTVTFTLPERLQILGTALEASVTAGGSEKTMQAVGDGYEVVVSLPANQQVQVYVAVRRVEDGLLLSAAEGTAWLGNDSTALALPEQRFVYAFDVDGDGVFNLVEIERGTSPITISLDYDADGLPDDADRDDDNDGVPDDADAFPFNGQEFVDTDGDGIGNNADTDDDNDGVIDDNDAFPLNGSEIADSDFDGVGDNADSDADGNGIQDDQEDTDGDGVPDAIDLFPDDYYEWADTDGDGIGDSTDADDDNNGIVDYREGSQIIVAYVDNASISLDGIWDQWSSNGEWYDEWGKATDSDSANNSLETFNYQIENSGSSSDGHWYNYDWNTSFEMLHDGRYLYIKVDKEGEQLENWFNDSAEIWHDDSVELYFDVGYDQHDAYGDNDFQRLFRFRDNAADPIVDGYYSAEGMITDYATSYRHENGSSYVYQQMYEIRVDLESIGLEAGDTFGFEVAINDDDDGGERDGKWGWWAPIGTDDAWQRPSVFGKAKLQPVD